MAVRTYQLVLAAGQKRLSDVYGGAPGVINAADDIPYRQLILQAEGAVALLGSDPQTLSTTIYGQRVDNTNTGFGVVLGPFEAGPVKLSDLYALGVGATIHILGVPF